MDELGGVVHMGSMWIWWVIGAVIVVLVWTMGRSVYPIGGEGQEAAEKLLKRQLASGEIDKDDYDKRLQVLRGKDDENNPQP